jgi:hypothetical protein
MAENNRVCEESVRNYIEVPAGTEHFADGSSTTWPYLERIDQVAEIPLWSNGFPTTDN